MAPSQEAVTEDPHAEPRKHKTQMDQSPPPPADQKAAKFLANLKRATPNQLARDPDDAPSASTQATPVAKAPVRRKTRSADDEVSMQIKLDPGTGKRVVYVRVDKTLADRLQLIAMQNKIAGGDGPKTVNDIGIEALCDWLENREIRRAA